MKRFLLLPVVLLIAGVFLFVPVALSGSLDDTAKKADKGINSAGRKVDDSTKGMRDATDSAGKKAGSTTKTGADKVGGFFEKTQNTVEGWMKNLEKKVKD